MATIKPAVLAIDDNLDNLASLRAAIQEALPEARVVTAPDAAAGHGSGASRGP